MSRNPKGLLAVCLAVTLPAAALSHCGKGGGSGGLKQPAAAGALAAKEQASADRFSAQGMPDASSDVGIVRGASDHIRIGDKYFVTSVLTRVFGPEPAVVTLATTLVRANTGAFGGPCDRLGRLDGNFCGNHGSDSKAAVLPSSLATREGYHARACEAIVQVDAAIKFAAAQTAAPAPTNNGATATGTSADAAATGADVAPTSTSIAAAYGLFHPGLAPTNDVVDALAAIAEDPSLTTPLNSWRYVFLALCLAPDWQVL